MSLDRLPSSPHRGETAVTAIFVYDYHVTGARASVCPPGSLTRGWLDLFSSLVLISLPLLALLEILPAGVNLRRRDKMPAEMTSTRKLTVAMGLTLLTCSQGIMMAASKVGGKYPYNVATVPLFSELTKLIISAYMLYSAKQADPKGTQMTVAWESIRLFPIPSLIYLFHNNVQFYTIQYVDAATYQILGNLKIVTTGFLFRVFLKRHLSRIQWLALILLMCAATTSQISGCGKVLAAPLIGYMFGILSAWLSAFAGVYTEFLMKKNNDNLYWQNVLLYGFGTLFNALRLTYDDIQSGFQNGCWLTNAFDGYNWVTVLIVLNFAFAGMSVSWIMKFADTIVKVYATSSAMMITALLSIWFFNLEPTLQLFMGIVIACISLNLYFLPTEMSSKPNK